MERNGRAPVPGGVNAAARALERAERDVAGIEPFSGRWSTFAVADAWDIAAARDRLRAARGDRCTGYKLGWTSEAMRRALGISEPNYGTLWASMLVGEGVLEVDRLIHPKAEPEFAFLADTVLDGPEVSAEDVARSGRWAVSIEVVDPRWQSYDFDWLDNTADGSSAARYVVGEFRKVDVRPEQLRLRLTAGGVAREGRGEAALGSPAEAVAHLVRQLHARGAALKEGMVVLTGGITAPVDLAAGLVVEVSSPELGDCSLRCK